MNTSISQAIIMGTNEYGESDLIVRFLTPDQGQLKGVAKGARRSRKRFANCLDLFCLSKLEYELKSQRDLCFLHSGKLIQAFPHIRSDYLCLSLASYMIELTETLFPIATVDKSMFDLLMNSLLALNENKNNSFLRILFEIKSMVLGGYGVDFTKCCKCGRLYMGEGKAVFYPRKGGIACLKCEKGGDIYPGLSPATVKALKIMQSSPWKEVESMMLTDKIIQEIRPVISLHIDYRIDRKLKSIQYLEQDP